MSLDSSIILSGDENLSISFRKERNWKTPVWAEQKNAVLPFSKITKKLVQDAFKTRKATGESKADWFELYLFHAHSQGVSTKVTNGR